MSARRSNSELARVALEQARILMKSDCIFLYNTDVQPYHGGQCAIFVLENSGSAKTRVAFRIQHTSIPDELYGVLKEVRCLKAIKEAHLPRMPTLLGYGGLDSIPFIALEWVEGKSASWPDSFTTIESRRTFLRGVACANVDLLQVRQPGISALRWITEKIERSRLSRAKAGKLHGVTVEECQDLANQISRFHDPSFDGNPHILVHGDMQASNVIIDDNVEVQGIIDWGFAEYVPLQFAVAYPRFLTGEYIKTEHGIMWPQDSEQIQQDRKFYLSCIEELAAIKGGIAQDYYRILARKDESSRYWWLEGVFRLDVLRVLKYRDLVDAVNDSAMSHADVLMSSEN